MKFLLIALVMMSANVMASSDCAELGKCIEQVSKLTGKKYFFNGSKMQGGLKGSSNAELTAENADTLLTYILNMNDYARVPTAVKDTYMIVESADIRYQTLPSINVDAQTAPVVPQNYDYYNMTYKFKNFSQGQMREVSNTLRPFMSKWGRIIEAKHTGTLVINETASKLVKAYEMMKASDREWTKEEIAAHKEEARRMEEREAREAKLDKREAKKKS